MCANDNYPTPDWLKQIFDSWYDPCPLNGKGGLEFDWAPHTFVNPPYSDPLPWVEKAVQEHQKGSTVALLLRVDTSTKWFSKLVEAGAKIFWFNGRMKYSGDGRPNFATMLAILSR